MTARVVMEPIGWVTRGLSHGERRTAGKWMEESVIELRAELAPALTGLEEYSHVIVLYWMHLAEPWEELLIHPRGRADLPLVGRLATRGPHPPNLIGLTVCELVDVEGNILRVRGLDAYTDSPVLDIKPYDYYDVVKSPRVPSWAARLWEEGAEGRPTWVGP